MAKPKRMMVRAWVSMIVEINDALVKFPPHVVGGTATKLPQDVIADILEFGVSREWQSHMVLQNFDPLDNNPNEFVKVL